MSTARLEQVCKYYKDTLAVDRVDLDIPDGTFLVLLGPSGCGKSTTLRMIAGLERATSGEIWIDGARANHVSPRHRDIAMVFQNYALYPHMSVARNLSYSLRLKGTPRADVDRRVREVAASLDIERLLDRRPSQLSGGQRQRVALGRAIIRQPKLFLMDEPLSNLDAKLRVQTRAEIVRLQRSLGVTTVYVTHDQTEAMTMGSTIVVMNGGRVQQADTPDRIYRHPANTFVAQFIGTPPMNLLPCRLESAGDIPVCTADGLRLPLEGAAAAALRSGALDRSILLGFRPEDLIFAGDDAAPLAATLDAVEALGHEHLLYLRGAAGSFVVRLTDPTITPPAPGTILRFRLRPERLRFFDAATGAAISVDEA